MIRDERGAASLEATLVFPALLLILNLLVQITVWTHGRHVAQAAAREAARAGRAAGGTDDAARTTATERLAAWGPAVVRDPEITVDRTPQRITVTVSGSAPMIFPGLRLPISATAAGAVERFRSENDEP